VKKHKYSWCSASWDTLPETLTQLEMEEWEIFSVCPLGGSEFVKIVYRRGIYDEVMR
jgi:hypothetical protein